jgi:hypothetical protein
MIQIEDEVEVCEETAFLLWGLSGPNQAAEVWDCVGGE